MYSQPQLNWLEGVITERLSDDIKLVSSYNGLIYICFNGESSKVEIETNFLVFQSQHSDIPCVDWDFDGDNWKPISKKYLPAPGYSKLTSPIIEKKDYGYTIKYDILGMIYWVLSRQEEVLRTDLDEHGRFPAKSSHAYKYNYLDRPIVDEWIMVLGQVMQCLWPSIKLKRHKFNIKISHDVDAPSRYLFQSGRGVLRRMLVDVVKYKNFISALTAPMTRYISYKSLPKNDLLNTFSWIMDQSEIRDIKSAFYFLCGKTDMKMDADYEVDHQVIRSLMYSIYQRGHEIGLHPSYGTYKNPELIYKEASKLRYICAEEKIEQKQWGGRMHFLRWSHPTTLYGWENSNMVYDSTLGYADYVGFRCGTCFEYYAFDPVEDKQLSVRIRPLIAMESSVIAKRYMGLGLGEEAENKFKELIDVCKKVNGVFTLLWHNSQLITKEEKKLYLSVLDHSV